MLYSRSVLFPCHLNEAKTQPTHMSCTEDVHSNVMAIANAVITCECKVEAIKLTISRWAMNLRTMSVSLSIAPRTPHNLTLHLHAVLYVVSVVVRVALARRSMTASSLNLAVK